MMTLTILRDSLRENWKTLVLYGLVFALVFQVLMLVALMVRFQAVPNYVTFYNWFENVAWIIQSTPSWRDVGPIIWEEWLIEIGYMNYNYGIGLSEWSLNVIPSRLLVMFVMGAMVAWCMVLMRKDSCDLNTGVTLRATTGIGAVLVAMTNATMSWVVCCATPSWVVGLAMLGLGVSTSLAIENLGPVISGLGFGSLSLMIVYLAWRKARSLAEPAEVPVHA